MPLNPLCDHLLSNQLSRGRQKVTYVNQQDNPCFNEIKDYSHERLNLCHTKHIQNFVSHKNVFTKFVPHKEIFKNFVYTQNHGGLSWASVKCRPAGPIKCRSHCKISGSL